MAAGTWKVFTRAKRLIGSGSITLGAGVFKMTLHRASASANLLKNTNTGISTFASVPGEISARGTYVAGGLNLPPATGKWTVDGTSSAKMKFSYSTGGRTFKASTSALNNIKYAVIRNSTGAGAGKVLCYVTLSTAAFTISSGNTLTITPVTAGVFSLK